MNADWSETNKLMQLQLKKSDSLNAGIHTLIDLRNSLFDTMLMVRRDLSDADFCEMPFINAKGYHSKSIAYSLWHIFRIEDIVAHTLIKGDEQVFFARDYQQRMKAPIITTGNELKGEQIKAFSQQLHLDELFRYMEDVKKNTETIINIIT